MITVCCMCKKVKKKETWRKKQKTLPQEAETAEENSSHGFCSDCFEKYNNDISLYFQQTKF